MVFEELARARDEQPSGLRWEFLTQPPRGRSRWPRIVDARRCGRGGLGSGGDAPGPRRAPVKMVSEAYMGEVTVIFGCCGGCKGSGFPGFGGIPSGSKDWFSVWTAPYLELHLLELRLQIFLHLPGVLQLRCLLLVAHLMLVYLLLRKGFLHPVNVWCDVNDQ